MQHIAKPQTALKGERKVLWLISISGQNTFGLIMSVICITENFVISGEIGKPKSIIKELFRE